MTVDPLYGPDAQPPTDEDILDHPHGLSEAVIREQLAEISRKQRRAPRDRQLKTLRRDR